MDRLTGHDLLVGHIEPHNVGAGPAVANRHRRSRGQVAVVDERRLQLVQTGSQPLDLRIAQRNLGEPAGQIEHELDLLLDDGLDGVRRRVGLEVRHPAADLHLTELRMLELLPGDEPGAVALVVAVGEPRRFLFVLGAAVPPAGGLDPANLDAHPPGEALDRRGRQLRDHLVGYLEAGFLGRGPQLVDRLLADVADARGCQILRRLILAACVCGRRIALGPRGRLGLLSLLPFLLLLLLLVFLGLGPGPKRRGEGRDAEVGVRPGEEGAVGGRAWHFLQAGDLPEPLTDLLVEPDILGVDRLGRTRRIRALAVRRLRKVVVSSVGQHDRDVGVGEDVLEQGQ